MSKSKIPIRLTVSVLAVLLVAVAVPLASAFADGMNGMVGGGEKEVFKVDTIDDFEKYVPVSSTYREDRLGDVITQHAAPSNRYLVEKQQVFTQDVLRASYNELIVSYSDPEHAEVPKDILIFNTDFDIRQWMDSGAVYVELELNYSRDVQVILNNDAYGQNAADLAEFALTFQGMDGTDVIRANVPVELECNSTHGYVDGTSIYLNLTNEARTFKLIPSETDIVRAATHLAGCEHVSMLIGMQSATNNKIQDGDDIKFNIRVMGTPVNGYAVSNIFVGGLGICLIVGAVFATPWVDMGSFGRMKRRVKSRRRRR